MLIFLLTLLFVKCHGEDITANPTCNTTTLRPPTSAPVLIVKSDLGWTSSKISTIVLGVLTLVFFVLAVAIAGFRPLVRVLKKGRAKRDKKHTLAKVKNNGMALQAASEELRDDRDIVLAAVKQNGYALEYASHDLKGDRDVVLAAVKNNDNALRFASFWTKR